MRKVKDYLPRCEASTNRYDKSMKAILIFVATNARKQVNHYILTSSYVAVAEQRYLTFCVSSIDYLASDFLINEVGRKHYVLYAGFVFLSIVIYTILRNYLMFKKTTNWR